MPTADGVACRPGFEIQGHTNAGFEQDGMRNARPSYSRARSVLAFLLPRGITSARLEARGYGARRPLAAGTPRGLVPNKRVELHPVPP